jgi:hypothetical protein
MKTNDSFDKIAVPADLESRLETLIDRLAEAEKVSTHKTQQMRWWISGMAAGLAILLSLGIFLHSDYSKNNDLTAQATPLTKEQELACLEAQKALVLVSRNFNKGMDQLTLAVNEIEKSNNTINKTFKR